MTRSTAQRTAVRLRKQRQRDREREAARKAAEANAKRLEILDEKLAPAIMRGAVTSMEVRRSPGPVRDDNGNIVLACPITSDGKREVGAVVNDARMLIGPRVRIIAGKPARSNALEMEIGLKNREFTDAMKDAIKRLQLDWSDVGAGVNVAAVDYLRSGGGGGGDGGHQALMEQVRARARLEGAMTFLGAYAPGVCRVVLDNVPIAVWVLETDPVQTVREGVAWILGALGRLVMFYDPPSTKRVQIRTLGPQRSEYSMEVESEVG